ncbi:MAG TPA: c-type cytochrome domain-containing protein [Gemmata sp.]|nr:c-type cytochrome domain-containing protein [Gemmata sp.]
MPPIPDRSRKSTGPARGDTPTPQPASKQVAKPTPKPAYKPVSKPTAAKSPAPTPLLSPTPKYQRQRDESVLRFSIPVWWGMIFAVGLTLILFFEFGYTVGRQQSERSRSDSPTGVAAVVPTETPKQPTSEIKASPKPAPATTSPPKVSTTIEPSKKLNPTAPSVPPTAKKEDPIKEVEPAKPTESSVTLKFEKDILPIFQSKCISCHGGLSKKGGLDLRSLTSLTRGGNSGPGMKPGRPEDSPVWQSLKANEMPPPNKPQLTADEKQLILKWIAGGGK